jgi:maleylpyruvate isomerase
MAPDLASVLGYVRDSTRRFLSGLDVLTDADVSRDSLCPEWTVGHLLTHVARNAEGLRRSLDGARRGESVPIYDSAEARAADIEAGATRPIDELVTDVSETARLLDETWSILDAATWERSIQHHRLGPLAVRETPGIRWCEIEIHRADLAGDYRPEHWPAPFVTYLLDRTIGTVTDRLPSGVALDLHATDTGERRSSDAADARRVAVSGPSWALAAWLIGRTGTADSLSTMDDDLPELRPWL